LFPVSYIILSEHFWSYQPFTEFNMLRHQGRLLQTEFLLVTVILISSTFFSRSSAEPSADATGIIDSIARVAGMKDFSNIMEIDFTFSVKAPSGKVVRQWQWFPRTDDVIFSGKNPKGKKEMVTYSRKAVADTRPEALVHTIDAWFVNDCYWLLFPYFLANDPQKRVTRNNSAVMPISGKWATGVTVEYYKPDPKRPGNKFELFVDSTYLIKEWVFYPYESFKAVSANKWENYSKIGPFMVSLNRPAKDSKGMAVKMSHVKIGKAGE
jgi:hypothetical protein